MNSVMAVQENYSRGPWTRHAPGLVVDAPGGAVKERHAISCFVVAYIDEERVRASRDPSRGSRRPGQPPAYAGTAAATAGQADRSGAGTGAGKAGRAVAGSG
jgi:hypothetical protein